MRKKNQKDCFYVCLFVCWDYIQNCKYILGDFCVFIFQLDFFYWNCWIDGVNYTFRFHFFLIYASTPSASSFTLASPGLPLDQSGFFCNKKKHNEINFIHVLASFSIERVGKCSKWVSRSICWSVWELTRRKHSRTRLLLMQNWRELQINDKWNSVFDWMRLLTKKVCKSSCKHNETDEWLRVFECDLSGFVSCNWRCVYMVVFVWIFCHFLLVSLSVVLF